MSEIQNFDSEGNEFGVGEIRGTIIKQQIATNRETLLNVEEMLVNLMKTERVYSNDDILKGVRLAWAEVNGVLENE